MTQTRYTLPTKAAEPSDLPEQSDPENDAIAPPRHLARNATAPASDLPAPTPREFGGQKGPEPTRYGDWEKKGRCTDF